MVTSMFNRAAAHRFAETLDNPGTAGRARHDAETAELIAVTRALTRLPQPRTPQNFRHDLRAQLIAAADREGIGATAEPDPAPPPRQPRLTRPRYAVILGITIGVTALSGISLASGNANPGDTLYGVKRSTERAQLAIAGSEQARGALHLQLAQTRLAEAVAVHNDITAYGTTMSDMDLDTITGVRILTTWAAGHNDPTALDTIDAFTRGQQFALTQLMSLVFSDTKAATRTTTSTALIDAAAERSRTIRAAIACTAPPSGQDDALGPIPAPCPTTSSGGKTTTTGQTSTTVTVTSDGQVTVQPPPLPTPAPAPTTTASGTPAPTASASDTSGLLGKVGKILGGIVG